MPDVSVTVGRVEVRRIEKHGPKWLAVCGDEKSAGNSPREALGYVVKKLRERAAEVEAATPDVIAMFDQAPGPRNR